MGFLTLLVFGSSRFWWRCFLVVGRTGRNFDEGGLAVWRCQETPPDIGPVASAFRRIGFGRTIGRWRNASIFTPQPVAAGFRDNGPGKHSHDRNLDAGGD